MNLPSRDEMRSLAELQVGEVAAEADLTIWNILARFVVALDDELDRREKALPELLVSFGLSRSQAEQIAARLNVRPQGETAAGDQPQEEPMTEVKGWIEPELENGWANAQPVSAALGALDAALGHPPYELAKGILSTSGPGLGAWTFYYRFGWKPTTDRQRAGLRAVKKALIDNGYGKGIDLEMEVFGNAVTNRAKEFQAANGLTADGVVGPKTMRALLRIYFNSEEQNSPAIPDHLLARLACGESNDDPIAEGVVDADDEGLLQFHLPYWPGTSLEEAWTPTYEIGKAGGKLRSYRLSTGSWKGAVAAWNIGGTYAKQWVDAGYPASGGPIMGKDADGNPIDSFARATAYWNYIDGLPY